MTTARGSSESRSVRTKIEELFGADLRSLAAFRIVLAVLVLADLAMRATDLFAHYADDGVLPRYVLLNEELLDPWDLSLNLMNGGTFFQALVFCVGALAALGMLTGYRTRLMTIVVWVVLISIQYRNPLVLNAGDILLRLLLFWSIFLPLGARWSADRALEATPPRLAKRFLSFATAGLFLQIAFMYWFTALQKSGDEWRVEGTALYYALSQGQLATPFGTFMSQLPEQLLQMLTFSTLALEAFGPFLLFCPFFTAQVRTATALAFVSLHFGIWMSMEIGLFPWISAFCMVCFLPSWFWDNLVARLGASFPALPDAARRLRGATIRLIQAHPLPSPSRLFVATDTYWPSPRMGVIAYIADQRGDSAAYEAPPRATSGRSGHQEAPDGAAVGSKLVTLRASSAANLLAILALTYIFFWNLMTVSSFEVPERLEPVGSALGITQSWGMFAPYPTKSDSWHVLPGTLRGGQEVDLMPVTRDDFEPQVLSWEKPRYVADVYETNHWRKYMTSITDEENADQRLYFGRYVCGEWNARHEGSEELMTFDIVSVEEETLPDNKNATPDKDVLWEHSCF